MTKILIIDHDSILRDLVANWLGVEGFEVLSAEDGLDGVKQAYRHVPNLIICDLTVPQLDGYGVLLELRANPLTADIPIIFLTPGISPRYPQPRVIIEADDYLTKPFTQSEFLQMVKTRLEKKTAQEQELQRHVLQLEQALAHEHEQRLLKARFTAMVAHDFRNPLTVILSSNSLLRDYADRMDEERRLTHRNRIDASALKILAMLDEMLVLAEIDSGSHEFKLEPLNLGVFLKQLVEEFQSIYSDSHKIIFEGRFTTATMADTRLLQQITTNLISNAVKYSPPGSTVRVTLDQNDEQISLSIEDEGIGISADDQLNLFNAFHRGANVGSTPGTGLGLTIVKQAVDLYQGTIEVQSQIGSGTKMMVLLPIH